MAFVTLSKPQEVAAAVEARERVRNMLKGSGIRHEMREVLDSVADELFDLHYYRTRISDAFLEGADVYRWHIEASVAGDGAAASEKDRGVVAALKGARP
jgi:hypothetical protein